jgi:hypothetical protein
MVGIASESSVRDSQTASGGTKPTLCVCELIEASVAVCECVCVCCVLCVSGRHSNCGLRLIHNANSQEGKSRRGYLNLDRGLRVAGSGQQESLSRADRRGITV